MKKIFILFFILSYSLFSYTLPEGAKEIKDDNNLHIYFTNDFYTFEIIQTNQYEQQAFFMTIISPFTDNYSMNDICIESGHYIKEFDTYTSYFFISNLERIGVVQTNNNLVRYKFKSTYTNYFKINQLYNQSKESTTNNNIRLSFAVSYENKTDTIIAIDGLQFLKDLYKMLSLFCK